MISACRQIAAAHMPPRYFRRRVAGYGYYASERAALMLRRVC